MIFALPTSMLIGLLIVDAPHQVHSTLISKIEFQAIFAFFVLQNLHLLNANSCSSSNPTNHPSGSLLLVLGTVSLSLAE